MNFCFIMSKGPSFDRLHPMRVDNVHRYAEILAVCFIAILRQSHQMLHTRVSILEGRISREIKLPLMSVIDIEAPGKDDSSAY